MAHCFSDPRAISDPPPTSATSSPCPHNLHRHVGGGDVSNPANSMKEQGFLHLTVPACGFTVCLRGQPSMPPDSRAAAAHLVEERLQ